MTRPQQGKGTHAERRTGLATDRLEYRAWTGRGRLIWPQCVRLIWPHFRPNATRRFVLWRAWIGGRRGMGSRVELFEQIRRDHDREGLSIHALARRHGVHRRTVRQAVGSAVPPQRRSPAGRPAPRLGGYRSLIDSWLVADRDAPRKQRHTAHRVWERLRDEHGVEVSERQSAATSGSVAASWARRSTGCSCRSATSRVSRPRLIGVARTS